MNKFLLSSLLAATAAVPAVAGVNNINYQAVIKNGSDVVKDQKVELKFELLDNNTVVYSEEQAPTTNASGLVVCQLGGDELTDLNWGNLTLKVSVNLGSGYQVISNEAVSSVPTALYALKSADSDMIIEEVEKLIQANEDNAELLKGMGAEIARIDGLALDFENLGENLDMAFDEMQAQFDEVNGQLENLNMLGEVVRANETAIEALNTSVEAAFDMTEARFDKIQTQVDALETSTEAAFEMLEPRLDKLEAGAGITDNEVEGLVGDVKDLKETVLSHGADIARIDGLADDFENLGENLDNLVTEMNAKFDEVNGQLENLNQVAAVVRTNEENIETLTTEVEKLIKVDEETAETHKGVNAELARIDGLADDFENMGENLDNSFQQVYAKFEEVDGQLENLNQVGAVVRTNEENIETLTTEVEGILKSNEETAETLKNMGAEIARIDGLATDFENLGENLDNLTTEMTAKFEDVEKQLENLNQVGAVVCTNEENIETLTTEVEKLNQANEETSKKLTNMSADIAQIEGLAQKVEEIEQGLEGFNEISEKMSNLVDLVIDLQAQVEALEAKVKALEAAK